MTPGHFQLLVFDWDGTLADSLDGIVDTVQAAARASGFPQREREQLLSIIGLGLEEGIELLYPELPGPSRSQLADAYRQQYRRRAEDGIRLFPGAAETIRRLHAQGFLLAVATGKSRRGLDRALSQSGLGEWFHISRCADEAFSKPHPLMLEEIMLNLGVDADRTLMIGDSRHDLQMAANAGVRALAVEYGAEPRERLLEFAPMDCLASLYDLPEWLMRTAPGASEPGGENDN